MAQTAVTGFSEPFVDTHPFYRATYTRVIGRTATGSGNGSASIAQINYQQRLGQLTDFTFPYRFGGRFYLGVRAVLTVTATASGLGTASSSAQVLRQRQGTGSGTGSESATRILVLLRSATGSGVGTMDSTGLHIAPRTASGSGVGSQSATGKITPVRTAVGSGSGDSVATFIRVPLRTATGSGVGSGDGVDLVINIRTALVVVLVIRFRWAVSCSSVPPRDQVQVHLQLIGLSPIFSVSLTPTTIQVPPTVTLVQRIVCKDTTEPVSVYATYTN